MGVMACDRGACDSIMCNHLILDGTMYICPTCLEELNEYKLSWPAKMQKTEVRERIEAFMKTDPGEHITLQDEDVDAEFERLTKNSY